MLCGMWYGMKSIIKYDEQNGKNLEMWLGVSLSSHLLESLSKLIPSTAYNNAKKYV